MEASYSGFHEFDSDNVVLSIDFPKGDDLSNYLINLDIVSVQAPPLTRDGVVRMNDLCGDELSP